MKVKKILAVILFVAGIFSLLAGFLFTFITLNEGIEITGGHISTVADSLLLAIACLGLGVKLGGREKWKGIIGTVMLVLGALYFIAVISSFYGTDTPDGMLLGLSIVSFLLLLFGGFLVKKQREINK